MNFLSFFYFFLKQKKKCFYVEHIWAGRPSCGIESIRGQSGFLWMQNPLLSGYSAWWYWAPLLLQLLHWRSRRLHMRECAFPFRSKFTWRVVSLQILIRMHVMVAPESSIHLNLPLIVAWKWHSFSWMSALFLLRNAIYIPLRTEEARSLHSSGLPRLIIRVTFSSTARSQVWGVPF